MRYLTTCFIICSLLILTPFSLHGQEEIQKYQKLDELMSNGKYFEAKKLYKNISDTLSISPDIELLYKFRKAQFLNKRDSLAIYLEKYVSDYYDSLGKELVINMYTHLFSAYIELGNKDKAIFTYERIIKLWNEILPNIGNKEFDSWQTDVVNYLNYAESVKDLSPVKMKRGKTSSCVDMKEKANPIFQAKYNGISQNTFFDTGLQFYCVLSKRLADGMGLKCDSDEKSKKLMNNSLVGIRSIIDSIEVGNITLYNIPAYVYNESESFPYLLDSSIDEEEDEDEEDDEEDEEYLALMDSVRTSIAERILLGLPAMRMIGKILADYDNNRICFPVAEINADSSKEANIYIYEGSLFSCLQLNGVDFLAHLDTGSDAYIDVDAAFYEKYQNELPLDTTITEKTFGTAMIHQVWDNINFKSLEKPVVVFDNKLMQPHVVESIRIYPIDPMYPNKFFDGVMGYSLYRRIGKKVLLDFDSMRLEAIQ